MSKLILLIASVAALQVQAEQIRITRVTNLGAVKVDMLDHVREGLKVNGTLIRPDLSPYAGAAFHILRPAKVKTKRSYSRCAAGSYLIEMKTSKETGCLEDPRAAEIAKALSVLNRLELFSQAAK